MTWNGQELVPDIIAEVRKLTRDATPVFALTEGRIFAGQLPEKIARTEPKKAVIIRAAGGMEMIGNTAVHRQRIGTYCYGETHAEAMRVARAVQMAYKYSGRQGEKALVHWINPAGGFIQAVDPDLEWPLIWMTWTVMSGDEAIAEN